MLDFTSHCGVVPERRKPLCWGEDVRRRDNELHQMENPAQLDSIVGFQLGIRMPVRQIVEPSRFNEAAELPFELRLKDFEIAMQDVYDFFYDVNLLFAKKGLPRLDDNLRPAIMSGLLSDMLTASMSNHSRSLTQNRYFNGHPDLVVGGVYENDSVRAGAEGVEIKTTRKRGGAVDTHGAREQWMCVFVYDVDQVTEPAQNRRAMTFREVYLGHVTIEDFRQNDRGRLGTRTATLDRRGIAKIRSNWIYRIDDA